MNCRKFIYITYHLCYCLVCSIKANSCMNTTSQTVQWRRFSKGSSKMQAAVKRVGDGLSKTTKIKLDKIERHTKPAGPKPQRRRRPSLHEVDETE